MIVILLSGKAQAGKDTFYQTLWAEMPIKVLRVAFADELKEVARNIGWDGKKDERGGKFLQELGSSVREYKEDIWVNKAIETLKEHCLLFGLDKTIICFTDCRYPNELSRIKSLDLIVGKVITVRIVRPNHISSRDGSHISETALDDYDFDYRICNDGTLEEYRAKVVELVERVLESGKEND